MTLRVNPPVTLGRTVRVSCYIPDNAGGDRVYLGIPGFKSMDIPRDRRQYVWLVENLECGEWQVICMSGNDKREATLEVKGIGCSDGG